MKKKKPSKGKKQSNGVTEVNAWVRPVNVQAKYWTMLIGQIKGMVRGTERKPVMRVEFVYRLDGSRLPKPEMMDFESTKLALVTDLRARVKKANPAPIPDEADDYVIVEEVATRPDTPETRAEDREAERELAEELAEEKPIEVPREPEVAPVPPAPPQEPNPAATPERKAVLRERFANLKPKTPNIPVNRGDIIPGFNTLPL